jgi:hypothetical protein
MKTTVLAGVLTLSAIAGAALAQAPAAAPAKPAYDYVVIKQELAVNKPAAEAWKKVGGYCDIKDWIAPGVVVPCVLTTGTGEVGTNRLIAGRINEVMTAKTELGYGYAQPLSPDQYHGFVEIAPTGKKTSKIVYTLVYDQSIVADQAAKDNKRTRLTAQFKKAMENMKAIAEK